MMSSVFVTYCDFWCQRYDDDITFQVSGKQDTGEIVEGEYNTVLFAVGRTACTKTIGLEEIGVKLNPR
jgi:pyruvate/2-oxoglutarate dehydrogenase complex dihydrolipoamide dehydrogenase (E3) component